MSENRADDSDLSDGPADERPATSASGGDDLTAALQEKEALQDRLLRTAAEFDNYRKRIDRERRELSEYAAADLLSDLLPVIDDLERALQASAQFSTQASAHASGQAAGQATGQTAPTGDTDPYRQGVELILRQMIDILRKRGVKPIDAAGADFDPNFHQAVMHEVSSDHREGEVMQDLRRGYMLGERLLRPAMVKVAKSS